MNISTPQESDCGMSHRNLCNSIVALLLGALTLAAQPSVVTYHNDNARTGQYLGEILLTPSGLSGGLFGKRYLLAVDGAVYAQPLYLSRVKIAGKGFTTFCSWPLRTIVFTPSMPTTNRGPRRFGR
jgi:hypothetical protein